MREHGEGKQTPPVLLPLLCAVLLQTVWQRSPPPFDPMAFITKSEYVMFFGRVFRIMNHPKNEELERRRLNARLGRRQAPLRKAPVTGFQLDASTRAALEVSACSPPPLCPLLPLLLLLLPPSSLRSATRVQPRVSTTLCQHSMCGVDPGSLMPISSSPPSLPRHMSSPPPSPGGLDKRCEKW